MNWHRFWGNLVDDDSAHLSEMINEEARRYSRMDFQEKRITAEAIACVAERYLTDGGLKKMLGHLQPYGLYAQAMKEWGASDDVIEMTLRRAERFIRKHLRTDGAASAATATENEELLKAEKRFLLCHRQVVEGCRMLTVSFRNGDQPEGIFKLKTEIRFLLARLAALEVDMVLEYFQSLIL